MADCFGIEHTELEAFTKSLSLKDDQTPNEEQGSELERNPAEWQYPLWICHFTVTRIYLSHSYFARNGLTWEI